MANLTFVIPDEYLTDVVEAFAVKFGYQDEIQDPDITDQPILIPNPVSKAKFAKNMITNLIRITYKEYMEAIEVENAKVTAAAASTIITDQITDA